MKQPPKKTPSKKTRATSDKSNATGTARPLVQKQPQSKQAAAIEAGIHLHTNDTWAAAYFNKDDLHCVERELFG